MLDLEATCALIERLYRAFNDRDLDTTLASLASDVDWPNGMEGGRVYGRDGVREYWTRQWVVLDPRVTPVAIAVDPDGRVNVLVHQQVYETNGQLVVDHHVRHVYELTGDLVQRMEIRPA